MPFKANALIAEHVFGFQVRERQMLLKAGGEIPFWDYYDEAGSHPNPARLPKTPGVPGRVPPDPRWKPVPHYLTDWAACGQVLTRMNERGFRLNVMQLGQFMAWFLPEPHLQAARPKVGGQDTKFTVAVGLAALEALGVTCQWPEQEPFPTIRIGELYERMHGGQGLDGSAVFHGRPIAHLIHAAGADTYLVVLADGDSVRALPEAVAEIRPVAHAPQEEAQP